MDYTDFILNIDTDLVDGFFRRKEAVRAKNKAYLRKTVTRTSVAAALTAILTAGIWLVIDNGDGGDTSTPILQNPSEDTPLPPVNPDEEISTPDTSTDEIDWDSIRLNAVYGEGGAFSGEVEYNCYSSGLFITQKFNAQNILEQEDGIVFAMCLYPYIKGFPHEEIVVIETNYKMIFEDNEKREKYFELESAYIEAFSKNKDWEEPFRELYTYRWNGECEARKFVYDNVTPDDEGREKLFAELEEIGIKVFEKMVDVYMNSKMDLPPMPHKFYVVYITKSDVIKMQKLIEESGDTYGINLVPAFKFLREDYEYIVTMDDGYFVME